MEELEAPKAGPALVWTATLSFEKSGMEEAGAADVELEGPETVAAVRKTGGGTGAGAIEGACRRRGGRVLA